MTAFLSFFKALSVFEIVVLSALGVNMALALISACRRGRKPIVPTVDSPEQPDVPEDADTKPVIDQAADTKPIEADSKPVDRDKALRQIHKMLAEVYEYELTRKPPEL
jgi:hypothetical protein